MTTQLKVRNTLFIVNWNIFSAGLITYNYSIAHLQCDLQAVKLGKKKFLFGGKAPYAVPTDIPRLYNIVSKTTGCIGGNSYGGPIYGEITQGSMQKLIQLMIDHTGLSQESRFIDIGCGLGKPSLHVAQQVGVELAFGLEVEALRVYLGMHNLRAVLEAAMLDSRNGTNSEEKLRVKACFFALGDITEVTSLDPFTHVYMFNTG